MSKFEAPLVRVTVKPHPDADSLEIAQVGDYQSIIRKDQFKTGDLAVYIPEQAIVPPLVLEKLNLTGKLSGPNKDRVKALKLRGIVSQGILYPVVQDFEDQDSAFMEVPSAEGKQLKLGEDGAEALGLVKYEPVLPSTLSGEVYYLEELKFKFDIQDFKKHNKVFIEGERVVITEKLHGSFTIFGKILNEKLLTDYPTGFIDGTYFVSSKGLIEKGTFFQPHVDNVYTRNLTPDVKKGLDDMAKQYAQSLANTDELNKTRFVFIVGETLGVQKGFQYGTEKFRMFGAGVVLNSDLKGFLDFKFMKEFADEFKIPSVPILFEGRFNKQAMIELTKGKTTLEDSHTREGVVIYAYNEGRDELIGRRILKYVGDDYLAKQTGEEFN